MSSPRQASRSPRTIAFTLFALLLNYCPALLAQETSPDSVIIPGPSFKDVLNLEDVGGIAISPDGNAIAYTLRTTDWENNRFDNEIWLARGTEKPFQITRTEDGSSSNVQFSPDGSWLSFTADRGNENQIFLMRPDGGEAWALTKTEEGVGGYEWSPDGSRIAFTMTDPDSTEKKREESFGAFAVEDNEYQMRHLWIVVLPDEPAAVEADRLTEGRDFTVNSFEWSPDGSRIVFGHQPNPLINSFMATDISLLSLEDTTVTALVNGPGPQSGPVWSPDGKWIVYSASGPDSTAIFYTNSRFFKIPATGGEPIRLAADLDEDPFIADWNPQGIFLIGWERTNRSLFQVDPNTGVVEKTFGLPNRVWSASFTPNGEQLALLAGTDESLGEIYRTALNSPEPVQVTNMTAQIDDWEVGSSEVISWQSKDGATIEGVLHKPEGFDPDKKYPLLVVIHGGPTGIDYPTPVLSYVYPVNQWLAKGALVLRPNYRGSAGYGEAFRSLNVRNLGVGDAWDVLSGVDYLVDQGFVDTNRMGSMGWSQGGYISAFLTTNTDRFSAISVGAGISNWVTYYVNTDIHPFTKQYLKDDPWRDAAIYAKTSPMTNILKATTPTLIQHGEFDQRVPIPNARELYQGLLDVGVETKLIVYKGFGHGITKPKERLAAIWHNWQWFGKHIWGEDVVMPVGTASP